MTNHGLQVNQHNRPAYPVNSAQDAMLRREKKNKRVNTSGVHSVQAVGRSSYTLACSIISMTGAAASITYGLQRFQAIHDIYHSNSMTETYPAHDTRALTL